MRTSPYLVTLALLAGAMTAQAAVLINRADVGTTLNIDYAGTVLGLPSSSVGALGTFVYTGASSDGRTFNFSYNLTNDSSTSSRLRSFGFDVLGATAITGLSSTGTYSTPIQNPLSALIGTDLCFTAAGLGGCATGANGISSGQSTTGSFALTFASVMDSVQLDDFTVNFQGVSGLLAGAGSGQAVVTLPGGGSSPVITAPEAESWVMMILGFGVTGAMLRAARRRSPTIVAGQQKA